ncbi:hypothetical protein QTL86_01745 [Cellulosilyticum sp. ST5]|uniref:hypothetical protein n=1 Tax=Cellulosilyticum sp. ST5 TaxID=3055805 RepID=UPI0039778100
MFKVIGVIVWILGGVANLYLLTNYFGSGSFLILVIGSIVAFLAGLIFWTLGVLFREMKSNRQLIYELKKEITIALAKGSNKPYLQSDDFRMIPINSSVWLCRCCGAVNTSSLITCKICGKYK